ncbi:MAG: SRPBCC family protein [Anaerolineales bacterium]|nr:SRPBCC family protein [Anaerolineales bacterium]
MKIEKSIEIAAPPERIWPFFVDPEKVIKWSITFRKYQYTGDQRSGVGTPLYIEEKAGGPLMKMNFEITEWVENERIRLKMISGASLKSYEQLWTLALTNSGSEFTFYEEIVFPLGVIGKLIGLVSQGSSYKFVTEMQSKLKSLVEA